MSRSYEHGVGVKAVLCNPYYSKGILLSVLVPLHYSNISSDIYFKYCNNHFNHIDLTDVKRIVHEIELKIASTVDPFGFYPIRVSNKYLFNCGHQV